MKKTDQPAKKHPLTRLLLCALLAGLLLSSAGCPGLKNPKEEEALARGQMLDGVRASMVRARVYFKRDIANEFGSGEQEMSFPERLARRMVERKMSLDLGGIVLDDRGHVLIADPETEMRLIDRIEVIGSDGQERPAKLLTIVKKMDAAILEVSDHSGLRPVAFTKSKNLEELIASPVSKAQMEKPLPPLRLVSIFRSGRDWHIRTSPLTSSYRYDSDDSFPEYFLGATSGGVSAELSSGETMGIVPSLIADKEGNFIGLTIRGILDLKQKYRIWKGQDVLNAITADLNADDFRNSRQALKNKYAQLYHQVKIYYRQPSEEEYGRGPLPERIVYGLAIDPVTLLVPLEMSRREAKQIESIEVTLNSQVQLTDPSSSSKSETSSAELIGVYRDFAAFVIRVKDVRFGKWIDLDRQGEISRVVPLQTVHVRRRFGRKDVKVWYTRCLRENKGYGDALHLEPSLPIFAGSLLLDLDGRLAGFYLRQRLPAEEQRIMARVGPEYYSLGRSGYVSAGSGMMRIFNIDEIIPALRHPANALDPNIRSMSKAQAKRRMWLGIEYVGLNRELAKSVNLEPFTKDGSIGFVVSALYQGSLAAHMGIQPGDVLLSIKDISRSRKYPTELRSSLAAGQRGRYGFSSGQAKVWKSRQNFLTEFLAAIGPNRSIEVTFCSQRGPDGWKLVTKTVKTQQAPLDYDSAEKYRDRTIGITVRDLTYEVRQALKMLSNAPGVVVSKIEEGTPAAVARISEGELITRIDTVEVTSVEDFKEKIAAARQAERDNVKIEILRLGKTRVADLSLSE